MARALIAPSKRDERSRFDTGVRDAIQQMETLRERSEGEGACPGRSFLSDALSPSAISNGPSHRPGPPGCSECVRNKFTEELKQTILDALHNANDEGLFGFVRGHCRRRPPPWRCWAA